MNMDLETGKRKAEDVTEEGKEPKVAKVEEDRVARLPVGKNLVQFDGKGCTHEVAWPPGQTGSLLPPPKREGPPAREYPFTIDPFQQTAINALEAGKGLHAVLPWCRSACCACANLNCVTLPCWLVFFCAGHSVLVAAHTSAGKTVVAEYAFAMALR